MDGDEERFLARYYPALGGEKPAQRSGLVGGGGGTAESLNWVRSRLSRDIFMLAVISPLRWLNPSYARCASGIAAAASMFPTSYCRVGSVR